MSDHEDEGAPQPMELEGDSNAEQQQQQQEQHEEEHDDAGAEGESKENGGDEAAGGDSTVTPLKRPMSAYFLFLADARPGVIAILDAESQAEAEAAGAAPGEPFKSKSKNVALVGKMLGDKWKAMTDEEKEPFFTRGKELKEAYDEAVRLNPALAPSRKTKHAGGADSRDLGADSHENLLPLARVKKVIELDEGRGRMTKEALLVTEKAAEHFIAWVATRAHLSAASHKRKGLKGQDLENVVRANGRLEFLRGPLRRDFEEILAAETRQAEERRERAEENKRKKQRREDEGEGEDDADAAAGAGAEADLSEVADNAPPADADGEDAPAPVAAKPKHKPVRTIDSMFRKA